MHAGTGPVQHDRTYFALLQRVSTLEAEKDDLHNQVESLRADVLSYHVVSQELEEELKAAEAENKRVNASAAAYIVRVKASAVAYSEIKATSVKSVLNARLDAARGRNAWNDTRMMHDLKASNFVAKQLDDCKATSAAQYERIRMPIERRSAIARVILSSHKLDSWHTVSEPHVEPHMTLSSERSPSPCCPTDFSHMSLADASKSRKATAFSLPPQLEEAAINEANTLLAPVTVAEESIRTVT